MKEEEKSFFKKYKKEIIIISIAILVFSTLFYFLFVNKKIEKTGEKVSLINKAKFSFGDLFGLEKEEKTDNNEKTEESEEVVLYTGELEGLIKVWDRPVAGYGFYTKKIKKTFFNEGLNEETTTVVDYPYLQFVDSETGFIYEKDLTDIKSVPYQVTTNSYPNVVKAYFMNDKNDFKNRVFLQYLGENNIIKTVSATIPNYYGSTANLMNILSLGDNIKYFTVSANNKYAAFVIEKNKKTNGKDDIYTDWYLIDNVDDSYGKRIYNSELSFWKLSLTNKGEVYAYTTETAYESNSFYKLNLNKNTLGNLYQIFGNKNGMSFLINKNNLLVSIFTGSGIKLYTNNNFSAEKISDSDLKNLSFQTLSNKCIQTTTRSDDIIICSVPKKVKNYVSGLPDAWYQGMTTWEDSLYVVNNDYPTGQLLFDIKLDGKTNEIIDGKNLNINENHGSHLAFINKNDGALWTLNIENILYFGQEN